MPTTVANEHSLEKGTWKNTERHNEQEHSAHIVIKISMKGYLDDHFYQKHVGYACITWGFTGGHSSKMFDHKQFSGHPNYAPYSTTHIKDWWPKGYSYVKHLLLLANITIL